MAGQRGFQHRVFHLLLSLALLSGAFAGLSGCATVRYVLQAGAGQWAISNRMRPVDEVLKDPHVPARTKGLLAKVGEVKRFGESRGGLVHSSNYTQFVQLDRPAANWVVSACDPLAFKARSWSFPIAGSFTYLGWFDRDAAESFAADLRKDEGLDVDIRGASAYSTLGWFTDPVYSSMIRPGDDALGALVNTVLHEGVHETLYIDGQSTFNESVAAFVGDGLAREFFQAAGKALQAEWEAWQKAEKKYEDNSRILAAAYAKLDALYGSAKSKNEKLSEKAAIYEQLRKDLGAERLFNNATLIQYKTYRTGEPAFDGLLKACGGDWKRFLARLKKLKPGDFPGRQTDRFEPLVSRMIQEGC